MFEINKNVVFVKGTTNGAIYNFDSGKVYWINSEGCSAIDKYMNDNKCETDYIFELVSMGLIDTERKIKRYMPERVAHPLDIVWLEITQGCNLKCLHCYEGSSHHSSSNTMPMKKWLDVIQQLSDLNVKRVVVIGGEPCVSPFLMDILRTLCEKKIPTTLFTNATLLSQGLMDYIILNRDFIRVKVSVYGHNPAVHDRVTTVSGSFNKMTAAINYLTLHNVTVNAAVVIMKENQDYLKEIINYVKNSKVKYTRYDVIRNVFGGTQDQHTPTDVSLIKSIQHTKPNFTISKAKFDNNVFYNSCWNGKLAITEEGNVLPCVFERELICGSVANSSIKEILASDAIQSCWCRTFETIEYCKDCEFRFACKDCRPLGKGVLGDLSTKNPRCTYDPLTGKWNS